MTFWYVAVGLGILFWGRGIVRSHRGDLMLGFSLFVFACWIESVRERSTGVFSELGFAIMAFGTSTLVAAVFAKPGCPLDRNSRLGLGCAAIMLGLLFSLIL
jgi:hypothetical protein